MGKVQTGSTINFYANGFPYKYKPEYKNGKVQITAEEQEIDAVSGDRQRRDRGVATVDPSTRNYLWRWVPCTKDFAAEASKRGRPVPTSSFQNMIKEIQRNKNLDVVWWFGHGTSTELLFGESGNRFGVSQLKSLPNVDISSHFAKGHAGGIVFVSCNSATSYPKTDPMFLQAIANKLHIRVYGYDFRIEWKIYYAGVRPNRYVTGRGVFDPRLSSISAAKAFRPTTTKNGITQYEDLGVSIAERFE